METSTPPTVVLTGWISPAIAAILHAASLPEDSPERIIILLLNDNNATGTNPLPWSRINAGLQAHGIAMSKEEFQTGILARSRSSARYIGSRLGNPGGYFLLWTKEDIDLCRSDMDTRSEQIRRNRANLDHLATAAGCFDGNLIPICRFRTEIPGVN